MSRGFASFGKEKRQKVAAKGGKNAQFKGTGHAYNHLTARVAAIKSLPKRKLKAMKEAAIRLLGMGFTAAQLDAANLSVDEWIYFGGTKSNLSRIGELSARIKLAIEDFNGSKTESSI